jgi:DNA-directed RNA polymerase subunit RPC12/RpoP
MILNFKKEQNSIPHLEHELKKLVDEYKSKNPERKNQLDYLSHKEKIRTRIREIEEEMDMILNRKKLNDYYLNVGTLLHQYYENMESSKECKETDEQLNDDEKKFEEKKDNVSKEDKKGYKSVLTFFQDRENTKIEDSGEKKMEMEEKPPSGDSKLPGGDSKLPGGDSKPPNGDSKLPTGDSKHGDKYTSMKISDFVKHESKFKKKNIFDEYIQKIEPNKNTKIKIDENIYKCANCNVEMILYSSDGYQICHQCGLLENILVESEKPNYKESANEISYFTYKRINHYNEWLAQFQAKETTEIPQEVYDNILLEIKKERITQLEKLDTRKIRQYLKKIKMNKYYDHAAHILYQINGVSPPCMSKELEEKLRFMFKEIQGPFMEVCPKSRKNFLNYSYVLHKFVELLGLDEYKIYFPLLKDREKLHQTDMIWKKICEILGWDFIKSI